MSTSNVWTRLTETDYLPLAAALFLLQRTFGDRQYGHLSVDHLIRKIRATEDGSSSSTNKVLAVWSYGPKDDPVISLFFFLRRRHTTSGNDEPWAYCLTGGAKPEGAGGLSAADLRAETGRGCAKMRHAVAGAPDRGHGRKRDSQFQSLDWKRGDGLRQCESECPPGAKVGAENEKD